MSADGVIAHKLSAQNMIQLPECFKKMLNEFVHESWYQNIVKATKNKKQVFGLYSDYCSTHKIKSSTDTFIQPKLIIVGDVFYNQLSMNTAALQGFIQELSDNFEFNTDISSAVIKKLISEKVLIINTSTYNLDGSTINDDWKLMCKHIIMKVLDTSDNCLILSMGASNNGFVREIITETGYDSNNVWLIGHPSPKASTSNFRGSMCFKKINQRLVELGKLPVRFGIVFT